MIFKSLESVYSISLKDVIVHPHFGPARVDFIYKESDTYKVSCTLFDFNNAIKIFYAKDLLNIKLGLSPNLRVVK